MKKFKTALYLFVILFLFSSCGSIQKAFVPQKKAGSQEFLVQKKSPLVMPPIYSELPVPIEKKKKLENEKADIKSLITNTKTQKTNSSSTPTSSIEKLILQKINKN